jgi:(R,R)-butanediol dehydrogenase/meso-butanediol dehydrogenase/diacetyl reductase
MKALRWYAKKDLRYEDVPEPSPGPGQIKVKVNLAGICGTDLKEYTDGPVMIATDKVPLIIGHEFAGIIAELGEGVTKFKVGERVAAVGYWYCGECYFCKRGMYNICAKAGFTGLTSDGSMAEYVVIPGYAAYKLPDSVSDELGALVEPLSVSLHAVRQGNVRPGDTVAIMGAGTIGLGVLLAAKAAGAANIYVIDKVKGRGELALSMGATAFINPEDEDPEQRVKELTFGLGTDISFECIGVQATAQLAQKLARNGGTIVIVGVFAMPASIDFFDLMFHQKTIVGSPIYVHEAETVIALLANKSIDPGRLITSIVSLKGAVEKGFEKLIKDQEHEVKILLQVA